MAFLTVHIDLPEVNHQWLHSVADSLKFDPSSPLQLPSPFMLATLLVFFLVTACLHRKRTARNLFTALFSLYLYYKLSGAYVLLLLLIALSDYLIARRIGKNVSAQGSSENGDAVAESRGCKALVGLSVVMNVSILLFFKANGVFSDFLCSISSGNIALRHIAVPAGISFFCFQSISYVVDTCRGTITPLKSFTDYLFLLSYFPKMFLGPLVKNADFIAQMNRDEISVSKEDCSTATRMIVFGTVKFCIFSKIIGSLFVAPAFAGTLGDSGSVALMAAFAFTIQLYCDFSGYTDLACGVSLLAGYRLPLNFDFPYRSATITEFWRRWHISLSSWLRDYLYIPLGGSRRGTARTYLNLLVTMFLGGLWHGVGVMFVLWGLWHGVLLCLHKLWMKVASGAAPTGDRLPLWRRVIGTFFTFNAVAFGWMMFRSPDWSTFAVMLGSMFHNFGADTIPQTLSANAPAFTAMAIAYLCHSIPSKALPRIDRAVLSLRLPGQAILIALAIWAAFQCDAIFFASSASSALPIYANF